MSTYRTGVTRIWTITGNLTGSVSTANRDPWVTTNSDMEFRCIFGTFHAYRDPNDYTRWLLGGSLGFAAPGTGAASGSDVMVLVQDNVAVSVAGSFSLSLPLEEWIEITGIGSAVGQPLDAPAPSKWTKFWRPVSGQTASLSVSSGTASVTASLVLGAAEAALSISDFSVSTITSTLTRQKQLAELYTEPGGVYITTIADKPGGVANTVSVTASSSFGTGNPGYNRTATGAYINCTASGAEAHSDKPTDKYTQQYNNGAPSVTTGDPNSAYSARAVCQAAPDKPIIYDIQLRSMEVSYPSPLTVYAPRYAGDPNPEATGTGSVSRSYTQRSWSASGSLNGVDTDPVGVNEYAPLSAYITADSLTAQGEDVRHNRILFRGKLFAGIGLSHAASVSVDDCASLAPTGAWGGGWSGAAGPSPALHDADGDTVNDSVRWTAATGGTVTRSFTNAVTFLSYPKLRLRIKADGASKAARVAFGGKHWDITTGAVADAYTDIDIDLSGEHSGSGSTSSDDTKWPVHRVAPDLEATQTSDYLPVAEGAFFGVDRVSSIVFSGMANGAVYSVDSISLVKASEPTLDIMPAFYRGHLLSPSGGGQSVDVPWPTEQYPSHNYGTNNAGTSQYFARRLLLAVCDSQQVLEAQDSEYVFSTPPSGEGFSTVTHFGISLATLAAEVNRVNEVGSIVNPGWAATVNAPVNDNSQNAQDGYLNRDLPAVFLFGGGALYSGTGWSYAFDLALGSYQAQPLYDEIDSWPGDTDWFGTGGSAHGAWIGGSGAHGAVRNQAKTPESGVTVTVTATTDGAPAGSGTSATDGAYQTGSPYGKGNKAHTVTVDPGNPDATVTGLMLYSRKRQRVVFIKVEALIGASPASLSHPFGFYARAFTQSGRIKFWRSSLAVPQAGSNWVVQTDATTGDLDGYPDIALDQRWQRLHLVFQRETAEGSGDYDAYETYSDDFGETWNAATALMIADGQFPVIATSELEGSLFRAAFVPSSVGASVGTLKGRYQHPGDVSPSAVFTFQKNSGGGGGLSDLAVKKDSFDLTAAHEGGARWLLSCVIDGESAPSEWWSADDGRTWTRT